jgi:signal transduction histidine kinase
LIPLLYPDGRLPSPRWRPALWAAVIFPTLAVLVAMFSPTPVEISLGSRIVQLDNPVGLDAASSAAEALGVVIGAGLIASFALGVAALVVRARRRRGDERQQVLWVAYAAAIAFVALLIAVLAGLWAGGENTVSNMAFYVLMAAGGIGVPVASAIAILKFRLYDLDLVIKKTVVFATLAALIALVVLAVVALAGGPLVGGLSESNSTAGLLIAGMLIGLAAYPLWRVSSRLAERVVFGGRTSPYEALTTFSHRVADTYEDEDVLTRMAEILRDTTRAVGAVVWLCVGDEVRPVAVAGAAPDASSVVATGEALPALPGDHVAPVRHQGSLLGALAVSMPANDPIGPSRSRLVDDLASQAGPVLENVRLVEDLRESRRRIVAAQDERARKLERDIHDGAQQQLVALAVRLKLARSIVERDPSGAARMLDDLQDSAHGALEDLRDLARGIYPPLLADKGLEAAIDAQARKASMSVQVVADGADRYPPEVEATVYFCVLEALNNVAKYAEAGDASVELSHHGDALTFQVRDDGKGFDTSAPTRGTGLQGMVDRMEAVRGRLRIDSGTGRGTTVVGVIPIPKA